MSKSPEEYFQEQHFAPAPTQGGASFTEAELAFMRKYMGLDPDSILNKLGVTTSVPPASKVTAAVEVVVPAAQDVAQTDEPAAPAAPALEAPALVVGDIEPPVEPVAEEVIPQPVAHPAADSDDLKIFKETVGQQFVNIQSALEGLKADGGDSSLADALYRSLSTVQNSASYLGLDEVKLYTERTVGIVDQGRKSAINFEVLISLLEQECSIIENMISQAVNQLEGAEEPVSPVAPEPALEPGDAAMLAMAEAAEAAEAEPVATAQQVAPASASVVESTPEPSAEGPVSIKPEPVPVAPVVAEPTPVPEPVAEPEAAPAYSPPPDLHDEMKVEEDLDLLLRREAQLQMVGFYLGKQEFTVPTLAVQEVIRYETPAKMPSAPDFVAGVINLRGKMTPLVHLRDMLEIRQERETEDRFIIVCRRKGLQLGLIIERVHTMYRVPQTDIDWGIEGHLGINVDFISGLLKLNESLVGIVSVDRIIDHVLD